MIFDFPGVTVTIHNMGGLISLFGVLGGGVLGFFATVGIIFGIFLNEQRRKIKAAAGESTSPNSEKPKRRRRMRAAADTAEIPAAPPVETASRISAGAGKQTASENPEAVQAAPVQKRRRRKKDKGEPAPSPDGGLAAAEEPQSDGSSTLFETEQRV